MARFPAPNYNNLIVNDPQIVKVPMDNMGIGSRPVMFKRLGDKANGKDPSKPSAPEITLKHVGSERSR